MALALDPTNPFSVVQVADSHVQVKLASARFDASYGQTQVLFFKIKQEHAAFQSASGTYSTEADLLAEMSTALKEKLASFTSSFIKRIYFREARLDSVLRY
jgi:hypothetical protein